MDEMSKNYPSICTTQLPSQKNNPFQTVRFKGTVKGFKWMKYHRIIIDTPRHVPKRKEKKIHSPPLKKIKIKGSDPFQTARSKGFKWIKYHRIIIDTPQHAPKR